jgi:hypothetical protein
MNNPFGETPEVGFLREEIPNTARTLQWFSHDRSPSGALPFFRIKGKKHLKI